MAKDKYEGFVFIHRKFKNWEWYDNPPTRLIFEHCLYSANFKDEVWQGKLIKRGQFPTSVEKLAVSNGLTTQQTRTALNNLQITNEITIQATNRYSIITVVNWDLYQPKQQTKKGGSQQTNNKQTNKQKGGSNNNTIINNNSNIYKDNSNINNINNKIKENCVFDDNILKKTNPDFYISDDKNKIFEFYQNECPNLIKITGEKRSRKILDKVSNFLSEINYDWEYFKNLCKNANELKTIANTKIDFEMLLNCHIGIMNGKYKKDQNKKGVSQEFIDDFFENLRKEESQNE